MSKVYCEECENIKEASADFVQNGVTSAVCNSMKNDTGLNPSLSPKHTDCEDLEDANDCLVGNMDDRLEMFDVCDIKDFLHDFVKNLHNMLSLVICAICGLWTNIHRIDGLINAIQNAITNITNRLDKNDCQIEALFGGIDIEFGEDDFTLGTGIHGRNGSEAGVDLSCTIKGNLARFHGSIYVDLNNSHWGSLGLKNNGSEISGNRINTTDENWTIAILKFKKSKYPMIKKIYSDAGSFVNAGCAQIRVRGHDEGTTYPGQWGDDSSSKTVPAGWYYVRVDLANLITWGTVQNLDQARVTFDCLNMCEIDQDEVECK